MSIQTDSLIKELLDKPITVAIYGGGFKPPTKGHFTVVEKALQEYPEIDELKIFVGGGVRDGITQEESIKIWNIYKNYLSDKIDIEPSVAPVKSVLGYAKDHPDEKVYWILGAREGDEDDLKDIENRTKSLDKYPNIEVKIITTAGGVSGTKTRAAIASDNKEQFLHLIPDINPKEQDQIWGILSPIVKEEQLNEEINLNKIKDKLKNIIDAIKQESKETKQAFSLLLKSVKGDIELTDLQKQFIKEQMMDLLKSLGLVTLAVMPAGSLVALLLKALKLSSYVTPSAFLNEVSNYYQDALSQTEKEALKITYKNWDTFGGKECNNGFCDIFARNLSKYLPGSKIMSTEDPRNETLGHVWVEYKGKYFDAETPNGVNSWKELPWMKEFYAKNNSYPSNIENLNEVGEANLKPYKWEEIDREGYYVYVGFETESGTEYEIDLHTTTHLDDELNNLRALGVEFAAKLKGAEGSSTKIVVNKGEIYKVMATIVDIVKKYAKEIKAQAITYSPAKKSNEEDFGAQRDNLYRAFISKAFPGVKFEQEREIVAAILPNKSVNKTINEGKQVGPLYHYTSANGLKGILQSNKINASEENYLGNELYYISFTRNKNFHKKGSKFGVSTEYRITLDGDKLSNKYKIRPFAYIPGWDIEDSWELDWLDDEPENVRRDFFNATGDYDEQEERIFFKNENGGIDNIKNYILTVDKVKDLQETKSDPFGINAYAKELVKETFEETWNPKESFVSLSKYMIDNGMNIKPLPKIKVIDNDAKNASNLLGKTAYYDPNNKSITLYTLGRHPKDILRSFAHEMIHHEQNINGVLSNITTTNTNEDGNLDEIEREAYEKGNMMLRNWEDSIKNV
jgi:hypothetical protein